MVDETRKEVRQLLEDEPNFSTRAGLRLVLTMLIEIDNAVKEQNAAYLSLDKRVRVLEKKNLIMWMEEHKYMTAFYAGIIFILSNAWFVAGFRKPFIQFIFRSLFGVDIPDIAIP
jgi:hypothetical protein